MYEVLTPQATLLTFLAGPINLRRFIATRPEGTRPDPKLKNHYPSGPAQSRPTLEPFQENLTAKQDCLLPLPRSAIVVFWAPLSQMK